MTKYFEVEKPIYCPYRSGMFIYDDAYCYPKNDCGITGESCSDDNKFPSWCILKDTED